MRQIKVGAFQFVITDNIPNNWANTQQGIEQAAMEKVDLLVFPECALTGYPPVDLVSPKEVDFHLLPPLYEKIQEYADQNTMHIIVGSIRKDDNGSFFNSALIFEPHKKHYSFYDKRALWGWDKDNFEPGNQDGILNIKGLCVGVRICFEVRFPEYFRELYKAGTDLNVILFYDTSAQENIERYNMITSHIITRAVENVCHTLTVNTSKKFQTAPTCIVNKSGRIADELEKQKEGLLTYILNDFSDSFGDAGRREISNLLIR